MPLHVNSDEANMDPRHRSGKARALQRQYFPALERLNVRYLIIVPVRLIDWNAVERVAYEATGPKRRSPPLRPRLVAGLLYLQHTFDLCDEGVVSGWVENR